VNPWTVYIDSQIHKALATHKKYVHSCNEEDLHDLRVHLKKVRSGLFFIRQQSAHQKKELSTQYRQLKQFFRQAGMVRATGLRLNWLKAEGLTPLAAASNSYSSLQHQERTLVKKSKEYRSVLRKILKKLHTHPQWGQGSAVKKYIGQLKDAIVVIALSGCSDEWHELRKTIKRLLYALQGLKPDETRALITKVRLQKLEQLQEEIGLWNDLTDHRQWMHQQQFVSSNNPELKQLSTAAIKRINNQLRLHSQKVDLLLQEVVSGM
jgi:CHAD domain-containing protein